MIEPELRPTIGAARRAAPAWDTGRQQELKWAVMATLDALPRRRLRPWARAISLTAGAGCLALALGALLGGSGHWQGLGSLTWWRSTGGTERVLPRLADGSSIVLDGPSAQLRKTVETATEVAFQLEAGGAHFEVARRPSRSFRVHAGAITVHVIGTRFHVQRQQAQSRVSVDRGRVLVSWWGGSRELGAGEAGVFPPEGDNPAREGAVPPVADPHPAVRKRTVPLGAEALFSRADRARAAGRSEAAIGHLREILERHSGDPHAPMAAFTSGRLLLESLHRPREAAQAFAQARALARRGPLAEDALAREVEALHEAGDATAAHQRATLYLRLFPGGPRLKTVMRLGGVRAPS